MCVCIHIYMGFPGGTSNKESTCKLQEMQESCVQSLGWEDSPGGEHSNSLQSSCPEDPVDRGDWWATVHWVTMSQTQLKQLCMHIHTFIYICVCVCVCVCVYKEREREMERMRASAL